MEPTAKNVPKIRTSLLNRLELAQRNWSQFPLDRVANYTDEARRDVLQTEIDGLRDAVNIWVDPEWINHLNAIRSKIDPADITLSDVGLFAQSGFVVFPTPIQLPAVDYDIPLPVSAVMWTSTEIEAESGPRRGLAFSSYVWKDHYGYTDSVAKMIAVRMGKPDLPEPHVYTKQMTDGTLVEITAEEMWNAVLADTFKDGEWNGTGRNDWFFDTTADDMVDSMTVVTAGDHLQAASHIATDRTLFWTLNALLTAERHTERQVRQPSTNKSKKRRKAIVGDDEVHIIHLRKNAPSRPTLNPGTGRKLTHESKTTGHWRNQRFGPGRSLTKKIWISDFKRGEGLPPKDHIYSLDR